MPTFTPASSPSPRIAHSAHFALGMIAIVLFGFQMWISNVQTLPCGFFANASIGSVAGLGGMAAGISSLFFNLCTGWLVTHFGYPSVLTLACLLAPIGATLLFLVGGRIHRLPDTDPLPTPSHT